MSDKYIDVEAARNTKLISEIDNFRNRYIDIDSTLGLTVIFPGFEITSVEKNLYLIYSDSTKVDFKSNWNMRPDYVSFEQYGTVIYWWLILNINRIDSIEDFVDLDEVIIPSFRSIQSLVAERISRSDFDKNEFVNNSAAKYYKRYPLDMIEADTIEGAELLVETNTPIVPVCTLEEKVDTFTLDATDLTNAYVDLTYPPINYSSLSLLIGDYTTVQSYGYDYILKYVPNTTNLVRISWSADDCPLGNGMEFLLEDGNTLTITYVYAQEGCEECTDRDTVDGGVFS